jgi:hypothetical protein
MSKSQSLKKLPEKEYGFILSSEQIKFVNKERKMHLSGQSKSYTREEAAQIIKIQRG